MTDSPLVLIVDDSPTNLDVLVHTLERDYRLGIAKSGQKALNYVRREMPDLILLDIMMPEMNGFEVCERLKAEPAFQKIPVIFITALDDIERKTRGFEIGAVDYITKPFIAEEVRARVRTHLALKSSQEKLVAQNAILSETVAQRTAELQEMLQAAISVITLMAEIRDPYTAGHQQRVAALSIAIAKRMALPPDTVRAIELAGILHDIGKIRIPIAVINRPGDLLETEKELLKVHPKIGYDLLKTIPFPLPVADIVFQHHERMDGSGYPQGLKGDAIMLEARILAVADVTEAQSSFRPYRPALGLDAALAEIAAHSGKLYDAQVVTVCNAVFREDGFSFEF
ncbi:MAG: response regulator [Proteobacteria bacterium]|nr:response regulator [Pseudomonadota bacterium]